MADLGSIGNGGRLSRSLLGPEITGTVLDVDGNPASRTVRVHRRDTAALVWSAESKPTDGTYKLLTPPGSNGVEHQVICLDDTAGTLENDLIHRVIP